MSKVKDDNIVDSHDDSSSNTDKTPIKIQSNSKIIPYKGVPILNKFLPNLFAQGSFIIIKNNI